jgi:hypothetical protein
MESQLGVVQQVEGDECHSLMLWCMTHVDVSLVVIELGKGVARTIEFWEFELVGCHSKVTADGSVIVPALPLARLRRRSCPALGALCLSQSVDGRVQLVLLCRLVLNSGLERDHLILQML